MELKGLKINFLGDSITEGCGAGGVEYIFHQVLKNDACLAEARCYGIGGTRFAVQRNNGNPPWNENFDNDAFCQRFDKMDDDADAVVVFGGTNDYGHGNAPIGCFADRTPDTFYGACHYLFSNLIRKYIGKPIVVMTPLHRSNEFNNNNYYHEQHSRKLKDYVAIIREVAEYYGLPVLDLYKECTFQPEIQEIKDKFMPDGLHPNNEGHKILADMLKKFLERL
ncbi:MAG: SGNH/GDSL hydrolase family protein [Clostridia bacterium]|nr:SGNH/GDSL hydrolase family protein [Clostridia bacterium]